MNAPNPSGDNAGATSAHVATVSTDPVSVVAPTALLMTVKFGTISEISECTTKGAASRCSQKAQSERCVTRLGSVRS